MDCFYIGRLSGTKGVVWQYTAIDVASSSTWAELRVTPRNPSAQWTSALAHRVAGELAKKRWKLEAVITDNASEFRSKDFNRTLTEVQAKHIYIRAGRPQSNGCVERVQQTLLEECWKPAFARYLIPKYTGLQRDLVQELGLYNSDRIPQGRRIKGMTPEQAINNRKLWISNPQ